MSRLALLILLAAFSAAGQQQTTAKAGTNSPYGVGVQGIVGGVPLPVSGIVEGIVGGIPIPVIGVAGATSDVTLHDSATPTQHLAIDAAGKIAVSNSAFDITDRVARILGHIVCDSGCGSGANDVGLTTAADETATNRSASIAALRLLDTSLTAGSQLIGWKGDATLGAWVNVKNTVAVSGPLTDVQLRASAVAVSAASLPLPSGASTEATLALIKAKTDNLDVALSTRTKPADTQTVSGTVAVSNSFALDATLTGGSQKAIARGGAKGATAAADVTSTANGADHQGLDVAIQGTVTVAGTVTTTPPSNASTNVTQWAGTAVDTNSGTKSAGTVRVVIATDQPALTNKLLVTPDSVALPANQSVNVAQFGGTNTVTGTGAGGAGIPRVTVSNDSTVGLVAGTTTAVTQATAANLLGTMKLLDTGGTNLASILANDTTAAANGLQVHPAIAKAGPAATTAGRSELEQIDTVSGGQYVTESPTSNNAALSQKVVSVNTTTNVKASAGNVYGVSCVNANASACFVQFYNTSGSPTCGTSVVWSLAMPNSGVLNFGPGPLALGNFATGIGMCMGTTATGATACTTANSCTIFYK